MQLDLSGNWKSQLVPKAKFQNLWNRHQEWMQEVGVPPRFFASGKEMQDFRTLHEQHFRSMERAGLIRYTDASASQFHFTTSSAIETAHWSYGIGLLRAVTAGRVPRTV